MESLRSILSDLSSRGLSSVAGAPPTPAAAPTRPGASEHVDTLLQALQCLQSTLSSHIDRAPAPALLAAIAAALFALLLALRALLRPRPVTGAKAVPGLPLLGHTLSLGRWGVGFLSACREAYGPEAFVVDVGFGQRMCFVHHPALLDAFFRSPEEVVSFKPAVKRFTERVYGLPAEEFGARHEAILSRLRHLLVPAQLQRHAEGLYDTALPLLRGWADGGQVELWEASKALVFQSAGRQLFGRAFFDRWGGDHLQQTFFIFEENFEMAASPIPHLLLPAFRAARRDLLHMLRTSLAAGDFKGAAVGELLEGCGLRERLHPNVLLAVLWALQANSVAAMFWALAFLLLPENAPHLAGIRSEVAAAAAEEQAAIDAAGNGGKSEAAAAAPGRQTRSRARAAAAGGRRGGGDGKGSQVPSAAAVRAAVVRLALDRKSLAARCVAEAIRLRVHSVAIRLVPANKKEIVLTIPATDTTEQQQRQQKLEDKEEKGEGTQQRRRRTGQQQQEEKDSSSSDTAAGGTAAAAAAARELRIPKGVILAVNPFLSHHDPALFGADGRPPDAFDPDRAPAQLSASAVAPGVAGLGFGGGPWRCPGRFFAEMELALLLMTAACELDLSIMSSSEEKPAAGGSGGGTSGSGVLRALSRAACAVLPADAAEFGGARLDGGRFAAEVDGWRSSGDAGRRLPPCELRRLVGFKVPAAGLTVVAAPLALAL